MPGFCPLATKLTYCLALNELLIQGYGQHFIPVCNPELIQLGWVPYDANLPLKAGQHGNLEPEHLPDETFRKQPNFDLILVPCLAATDQGDRLGRGKGYYDRFLGQLPVNHTHTLIVAHACQIVTQLPTNDFDIACHDVIST